MALNKKHIKLKKMTDDVTKAVWATKDIQTKRDIIMTWIGSECNTPEEMRLRDNINSAKTGDKIDMIVSNMLMSSIGMSTRR